MKLHEFVRFLIDSPASQILGNEKMDLSEG